MGRKKYVVKTSDSNAQKSKRMLVCVIVAVALFSFDYMIHGLRWWWLSSRWLVWHLAGWVIVFTHLINLTYGRNKFSKKKVQRISEMFTATKPDCDRLAYRWCQVGQVGTLEMGRGTVEAQPQLIVETVSQTGSSVPVAGPGNTADYSSQYSQLPLVVPHSEQAFEFYI